MGRGIHRVITFSINIALSALRQSLSHSLGGWWERLGLSLHALRLSPTRRQERRVIPGFLLVRQLDGFYPAALPTYSVINQDSIHIEVPAYGGRAPARLQAYHLYDLP